MVRSAGKDKVAIVTGTGNQGVIGRRHILKSAAALAAAAGADAQPSLAGAREQRVIYSPAPPATRLHQLNNDLLRALGRNGPSNWSLESVALPRSINALAGLSDEERRWRLSIVTAADIAHARLGAGPPWRRYMRANHDLLFISSLYDVGVALLVIDPEIAGPQDLEGKAVAAPPRPSAVRLLAEALVEAGYGLQAVRFLDSRPDQAPKLLADGVVSASAWSLVAPDIGGYVAPAAPARYLPVGAGVLARVNAVLGTRLSPFDVPGFPPLISFAQALFAWRQTPDDEIRTILEAIAAFGRDYPGLPDTVSEMQRWRASPLDQMHPAARRFYAQQ